MGTIYNRLTEARHHLNLTQRSVAEGSGLSLRAYARYESGEGNRDIPSTVLDFYARNGINTNWILIGSGNIRISMPSPHADHEGKTCVPVTTLTAYCGKGDVPHSSEFTGETIAVKTESLGQIAEDQLPFAVHTEGRSMVGFGIEEGNVIIVNPAEEVRTGTIAMIIIGDKASIKKVYKREDSIDFVSATGDRYRASNDELNDGTYIRVCGRVMLVIAPPKESV